MHKEEAISVVCAHRQVLDRFCAALVLRQILSFTDLFLFYRIDSMDSRTI